MASRISTLFMANMSELFDLADLKMIEGDLPARAQRLVMSWARRYRHELTGMWMRQEYRHLPGLE
jgi:hypothetical protein